MLDYSALSRLRAAIRPAHPDDASALVASLWPDRSLAYVREFLERARQRMVEGRGQAIVVTAETGLCGFGLLTLWPRAAEISDLIVAPAFRDQGIGTAIIASLTEAARSLNATMVEIGAALWNVRALRLYRRLGFRDYRSIYLDLGHGPEIVIFLIKHVQPTSPG